jgi:hypothetical protein
MGVIAWCFLSQKSVALASALWRSAETGVKPVESYYRKLWIQRSVLEPER